MTMTQAARGHRDTLHLWGPTCALGLCSIRALTIVFQNTYGLQDDRWPCMAAWLWSSFLFYHDNNITLINWAFVLAHIIRLGEPVPFLGKLYSMDKVLSTLSLFPFSSVGSQSTITEKKAIHFRRQEELKIKTNPCYRKQTEEWFLNIAKIWLN